MDIENSTISVWLVLADGLNKGKIVLQKRNEETFPYVCQATWSGGVEPGETVLSAIKRECCEELGENFCKTFDFTSLEFLEIQDFWRESKQAVWRCHHYSGIINETTLKVAVLHKKAEKNFIFTGKDDNFFTISSGKSPQNNIVLFDDQYKVLKKYFLK